MRIARVLLPAVAAALLLGATAAAPAAARFRFKPIGAERKAFRPRIGNAMGILPRLGIPELASGRNLPVVYHGGQVMRNVTIHTIFWAPLGYHFDGSPTAGTLGYEALVKQFLVDVARDSGSPHDLFSTLTQYEDGHGPGSSHISYDPAVDSVDLDTPYPKLSDQCASPSGIATCVTDLQLEKQINQLIGPKNPRERGLSNIWFILLPPNVDTCIAPGSCATTAFAAYHSEFDLGQGATVYSPIPDPLVEFTPPPGADPQGNPEAEESLDTMGHETEEAITDPYGDAWMDPDGFEVADKCENGPQQGTPLGFAPDGSPYNQVINGHQYLIQDMWSNPAAGCVQSSTASRSALPLHTVSLRQFSPFVRGSLGVARRVPVAVGLLRGPDVVATARTHTRANGTWGPVELRSKKGAPHAVGDDREAVIVEYGGGRGAPNPDLIATGDGGNPFTESGYTGWFDLDNGFAVGGRSVVIGPCTQTGVLSLRIGKRFTEPPAQLCSAEAGAALVPTRRLTSGTRLTLSSDDNRAVSFFEPNGALVKLTVSLGEPNSVPTSFNDQVLFIPTGFPQCTAYLRIQAVRCTGLVPGNHYRIGRRHAQAGLAGMIFVGGMHLHGGSVLALINQAGRRLTRLYVAHLRVHLLGNQTQIASGTCQPGDFYGPPISKPPTSSEVGFGLFGEGTVCPGSGNAAGLSTRDIAQTDDFSGGQTITQVPLIESTSPIQDETLYGGFVASAQSGLPAAHGSTGASGVPVALTITRAGTRRRVFGAANVDTPRGVNVPALAPGAYAAKWVLRDANGDTRTITTRFNDEG